MEDKRFVCGYGQYKFCGKYNCRLAKYCSVFPIVTVPLNTELIYLKKNPIRKTPTEIMEGRRKYYMYNRLFGDLAEKQKMRFRRYYYQNREKLLRELREKKERNAIPGERISVVLQCKYDCENCPYEDCEMPEYTNKQEYIKLYNEKFRDRILLKKAEYRENHRSELANSEKLRNYRRRGYVIRKCILQIAPEEFKSQFENREGVISIIKINGNNYLSYITSDMKFSFRRKLRLCGDNLNDYHRDSFICTDVDGNKFYFKIMREE